jgi:hypothetical protein
MTQCLFFCGKGASETEAVRAALVQCGDVLLNHPSLVVELVELVPDGHHVDAHIRVLGLASGAQDQGHIKQKAPSKDYVPRSPEHIKSGHPDDWRPIGMEHEDFLKPETFDAAAYAGEIPDVPTQDMNAAQALHLTVDEARTRLDVLENEKKLRESLKPEPE